MQDLSLLMQGQASPSAQFDGKNDMTINLLKASVIEATVDGSAVTNFADVLASQLLAENADITPIEIERTVPPSVEGEETTEVGAIASLFVGNAEISQRVAAVGNDLSKMRLTKAEVRKADVSKTDISKADAKQDVAVNADRQQHALTQSTETKDDVKSDTLSQVKTAVSNTFASNDLVERKGELGQSNQKLTDYADKHKPLTNLDEVTVEKAQSKHMQNTSVSKADTALPLRQNIRDVGHEASKGKTFDAQLAASEAKLDYLTKGIARAEHNPVVANVMQTVQAAENGLQKMSGENVSSNHINTPFSSPNWSQAVQQKVLWMVGAADKSATLTLNPPELGPLKVVVNVDNQSVDTTFISESAEVRQVLQESVASLKDRMLESGIQLGQTNIGNQAQSEQAFQQALKQNNANAKAQLNADETSTQEAATHTEPTNKIQSGDGLVDTFV